MEGYKLLEKRVKDLMVDQINKELYSAYLYLDFANYYDSNNLDGFVNWYTIQAKEEMDHAMLFYKYLHKHNEHVILGAIGKPDKEFTDYLEPTKAGLEHEKYVTSLIENIYRVANEYNDSESMKFLKWFLDEQEEEEENASDLIAKTEFALENPNGISVLNTQLKRRKYKAPTLKL